MIANFVGRTRLPEPTLSDEVFGRVYYALSSVIDLSQTIAKAARSIFASSLSFVFRGQSSALRACAKISWSDVRFSADMFRQSLFGIVNPRSAWVKKVDLHISNATNFSKNFELSGLFMEEWNRAKSFAMRALLIGQVGESAFRLLTSIIRYVAGKGMSMLSLGNAKLVDLLSEGARASAENARKEIEFFSNAAFGNHS